MKKFPRPIIVRHSRGVVLILALLLLLVLTILGVGTLSSVSMQERMAGNANLQALAFQAASAGVTEAPEQWLDEANWPTDGSDAAVCIRGDGNWKSEWWPATPKSLVLTGTPAGFNVEYQTRVGCFEESDWVLLTGSDADPPIQLLVLSRGRVTNSAGDVVAEREIEIRLEDRIGEPDCLVQLGPLDQSQLGIATSKAFEIDASPAGCALQASPTSSCSGSNSDKDLILDQMKAKANTTGNYNPPPPVRERTPQGAWGDAGLLAKAANGIKIGIRAYKAWDDSSLGLPNPFDKCEGTLIEGNSGGCPSGGLTYISGDLTASGNCTAAGTIIVEGGWITNGTPSYAGNVLLLGGVLDVKGFGDASNVGLLILQKLEEPMSGKVGTDQVAYDPDNVDLGCSTFDITGGGNAEMKARDCRDIQDDWAEVNDCLIQLREQVAGIAPTGAPGVCDSVSAQSNEFTYNACLAGVGFTGLDIPDLGDATDPVLFPIPDCDGAGSGRIRAIASWREFIDRGRWEDPSVPELSFP